MLFEFDHVQIDVEINDEQYSDPQTVTLILVIFPYFSHTFTLCSLIALSGKNIVFPAHMKKCS